MGLRVPRLTRRRFISLGCGVVASGVGVGLYTRYIEPHWVELVKRDINIANLPAKLIGQSLVQISDLHVGPVVDSE